MPKAREVYRALLRDGWVMVRQEGTSHRVMRKGTKQEVWTHHDGVDLGNPMMARLARRFGYTLEQLRRLL